MMLNELEREKLGRQHLWQHVKLDSGLKKRESLADLTRAEHDFIVFSTQQQDRVEWGSCQLGFCHCWFCSTEIFCWQDLSQCFEHLCKLKAFIFL